MAGDLSTETIAEGAGNVPVARSEQQETILNAAIDIIRSKGAEALTVRNVAKAAGCSTTGVYTWFGGKQGLVDAIYVRGFESFDGALACDAEPGATGHDEEWLIDRCRAYRRWALDHPTEYQVMFGRIVPEHRPSDGAMARGLRSFQSLIDAVELLQANGHLVDLPGEAVAFHLWATTHGHVMLALSGHDRAVGAGSDATLVAGLRVTLAGYRRSDSGR